MLQTNDVVTPQHIAKLVQQVPRDMPAANLHAILSSGLFADMLDSDPAVLETYRISSLYRDQLRRLVGLKPVSLQLSFTVSMRSYREFVETCVGLGSIPRESGLRSVAEYVMKHPAGQIDGTLRRATYEARPKVTCAWFRPTCRIADVPSLARLHGYRVASLRSYFKFLTHVSRSMAEKDLPSEFFEAPIICAEQHDPAEKRYLLARRTINPGPSGRTVHVSGFAGSDPGARYWVPLERLPQ